MSRTKINLYVNLCYVSYVSENDQEVTCGGCHLIMVVILFNG